MPNQNLQKLTTQNILTMAQGAVGTQMFRHLYVKDAQNGEQIDVMNNGEFACAFFVSGVLAVFGLIDRSHATVQTTLQKMQENGWRQIDSPMPGAVVYWPAGPNGHDHLGFCIDQDTCISNSAAAGTPTRHNYKMTDGRLPQKYFWYDLP